jgi:hypothetical protein
MYLTAGYSTHFCLDYADKATESTPYLIAFCYSLRFPAPPFASYCVVACRWFLYALRLWLELVAYLYPDLSQI